jgi:hypothetical protein
MPSRSRRRPASARLVRPAQPSPRARSSVTVGRDAGWLACAEAEEQLVTLTAENERMRMEVVRKDVEMAKRACGAARTGRMWK